MKRIRTCPMCGEQFARPSWDYSFYEHLRDQHEDVAELARFIDRMLHERLNRKKRGVLKTAPSPRKETK